MSDDKSSRPVEVAVFGSLRRFMDSQGLPYRLERQAPEDGMSAHLLARDLNIPLEKIEAVFLNGQVINIYDPVYPGDRVAFFPQGTPGPYRVFLGMMRENRERERREKSGENGGNTC